MSEQASPVITVTQPEFASSDRGDTFSEEDNAISGVGYRNPPKVDVKSQPATDNENGSGSDKDGSDKDGAETVTKVRLARRTSEPRLDYNRIRSKTPIMGRNVPRLARHHSEAFAMNPLVDANEHSPTPSPRESSRGRGRSRSPGPVLSGGQRLSIEDSQRPINYHRTASIRRNRERRKKRDEKRKSRSHQQDSGNDEGDNISVIMPPAGTMITTAPTSPTEPSGKKINGKLNGNNNNNNNNNNKFNDIGVGVDIGELTKDYEEMKEKMLFYKNKFESTEKEIEGLKENLNNKENECEILKGELANVTKEKKELESKIRRAITEEIKRKAEKILMDQFLKNSHLMALEVRLP